MVKNDGLLIKKAKELVEKYEYLKSDKATMKDVGKKICELNEINERIVQSVNYLGDVATNYSEKCNGTEIFTLLRSPSHSADALSWYDYAGNKFIFLLSEKEVSVFNPYSDLDKQVTKENNRFLISINNNRIYVGNYYYIDFMRLVLVASFLLSTDIDKFPKIVCPLKIGDFDLGLLKFNSKMKNAALFFADNMIMSDDDFIKKFFKIKNKIKKSDLTEEKNDFFNYSLQATTLCELFKQEYRVDIDLKESIQILKIMRYISVGISEDKKFLQFFGTSMFTNVNKYVEERINRTKLLQKIL